MFSLPNYLFGYYISKADGERLKEGAPRTPRRSNLHAGRISVTILFSLSRQENTLRMESAMPADLTANFQKLDAKSRHVVQLLAVSHRMMKPQEIASLSSQSGWIDSRGKSLTKAEIARLVSSLMNKSILLKGSYSNVYYRTSTAKCASGTSDTAA